MMIKRILPSKIKLFLKKLKRKFILSIDNKSKLTKQEFISYLNELGIKQGDTILVHSSFGYLNVDISPLEVIDILKEIITVEGNILMPYYPPDLGLNWLKSGLPFDVVNTKSSMGVLTNLFAKSDNVAISSHPIKALAVWGKDSDWLISEHKKSSTPFDKFSPYYKAGLLNNSKTLGLGIEKNAYFHCCEDVIESHLNSNLYSNDRYTSKVNTLDYKVINVETSAHCPLKTANFMSPTDFLKQTKCKTYSVINDRRTRMYSVDNVVVMRHLEGVFSNGLYRGNIKK